MAEKDDKNKKKGVGKALDKIFMGAIIGGAIGSVLGMSLAPKKGKDTRKLIKEKTQDAIQKAETIIKQEKPAIEKEIKNLAETARQRGGKIFNFLSQSDKTEEEARKIPHEDR